VNPRLPCTDVRAIEAAMSNEIEPVTSQQKNRIAGFVLSSIVLIVMGILNLPYDYVEIEGRSFGGFEIQEGDGGVDRSLPRMAGWPLRFHVQYEFEDVSEDRYWSTPRLITNICIALFLTFFF
jgi:hypothetical protein